MLQSGKSRVRFPIRSMDLFIFFNFPNTSLALGSTQPLTGMSTKNLHEFKWRPARKADNLTDICDCL
jgi:hypothetical protein